MSAYPTTQRPDVTVYDVHGNAVGTADQIFGNSPTESEAEQVGQAGAH